MTEVTNHFLLVYRLDDRTVAVEDFGTDGHAAATAYAQREHEHAADRDVEVVLVGADSLETVRITHSHYFDRGEDVAAALERDLSVAAGH